MNKALDQILSSPWRVFAILGVLILLTYAIILPAPFKTIDDYFSIVENDRVKSFSYLKDVFSSSFFGSGEYYRPLVYFSFMLEYKLFKLNAFFYNLDNILLHVFSSMLAYLIVGRILKDRRAAFFISFLFAIHPIHWEAVSNIPGRSILLCAFFFLFSFYGFLISLEEQRRGFLVSSLIFFMLSLMSKETAVVLPLVIASYVYFYRDTLPKNALFTKSLPFFSVLAAYFLLRKLLGITTAFQFPSMGETVLGIITFLKTLFEYVQLIVLPIDFYFDHSTPLYTSFGNLELWLVLIIWLCILAFLFNARKNFDAGIHFWMSWIVFNFLTVAQIVPLRISATHISSADHFLYLPSVGIFTILVLGIQHAFKHVRPWFSPAIARFSLIFFFLFLVLTTIGQNVYSRQQIAMFKRSLEHYQDNSRVLDSLAVAYAHAGLFRDAEKYFRRSLKLNPVNPKARIGLGVALCDQGRYWEGIAEYDSAGDAGPLNKLLIKNRELAYNTLLKKYEARLMKEPNNSQLFYTFGVIYAKLDKHEKAIEYYQKALELDPNYKNALYNMAFSLDAKKEKAKVVNILERVVGLSGTKENLDEMAFRRLADLYNEAGQQDKAQEYRQAADVIQKTLSDAKVSFTSQQ